MKIFCLTTKQIHRKNMYNNTITFEAIKGLNREAGLQKFSSEWIASLGAKFPKDMTQVSINKGYSVFVGSTKQRGCERQYRVFIFNARTNGVTFVNQNETFGTWAKANSSKNKIEKFIKALNDNDVAFSTKHIQEMPRKVAMTFGK